MPVFSMRGRRVRGAAVVAAAVAVLGAAPAQAVADDGSAPVLTQDAPSLLLDDSGEPSQVVTMHPDGSYSYVGPATANGFRDSLYVGSPAFTGRYKQIVSGPHVTNVKVYKRYWKSCYAEMGSLVQNCQDGYVVYAAGFAACLDTCRVAGLYGSHNCQVSGSDDTVFSSEPQKCYSVFMQNGYSSHANEVDRDCYPGPIPACSTLEWHNNFYPTGNVTGPYGGAGNP
jgi:hypothetical protein